jgi:bifunctional DNase/RNase
MKRHWWLPFVVFVLCLPAGPNAAQENNAVETKIKTLMLDPNTQTPVVVLETVSDKRLLPIWIDIPEARAIALELEQVSPPRPLTHDLVRNILQTLGATVQRATITDIRNNTYFAVLTLRVKGQDFQIDSRPSDAIAIALRMKAPIYAAAQVFAKSKQLPAPQDARAEGVWKKLGMHGQDLTAELAGLLDVQFQKGILVSDVVPGGIAANTGIQRGDIITKANEKTVQSVRDLDSILKSTQAPAQLKLEIIKKGKPTIVFVDLPS